MAVDLTAIAILVAVAGFGSVAGYLGRIAQKLEDKRDKTYLTELPAIYSNILAFEDALTLFNNGGTIDQLAVSLIETNKSLHDQIFSADILVFRSDLYEDLFAFSRDSKYLQAVAERIKSMPDNDKSEEEKIFRTKYKNGSEIELEENLKSNPNQLFNKAKRIERRIKSEFKRYRSYSVKLIIVIFALGSIIGLIEVLKEVFKV